jgi:ammonia channel protein AmtB
LWLIKSDQSLCLTEKVTRFDIHSITGTIPTIIFVVFQMTFACIAVAIILGSVVDRMKFSSWIVFTILWSTFVYTPVCNWEWGGGWMHHMGALDFAGGNVVHINAGVSGLVLALFLGKRRGYGKEPMIPSSVMFTALGAGLFASPSITQGAAGLFYGNPGQVWIQFLSIAGTIAFSAAATIIVIYVTKMLTNGIRVEKDDELAGLDNTFHGERAFEIE